MVRRILPSRRLWLLAFIVLAACKARTPEDSTLSAEEAVTTPACPVTDTPSLVQFIKLMKPQPKSATEIYAALKAANCSLSAQTGILSEGSAQPADAATNSPRSFVTINGTAVCSTGPEGRIEIATFPVDPATGRHGKTTDEQFADVAFHGERLEITSGAAAAGCDSCHFGFVPIGVGEDESGRPIKERPFPLSEWHSENCSGDKAPHKMCRDVRAMLGL